MNSAIQVKYQRENIKIEAKRLWSAEYNEIKITLKQPLNALF